MNNVELRAIGELVECLGETVEKFYHSEEALENGDIAQCQMRAKEAQGLLRTMRADIFREIKSAFGERSEENEYQVPSNRELILQMNMAIKASGGYLAEAFEGGSETALKLYKKKIVVAINTVEGLFKELYEND